MASSYALISPSQLKLLREYALRHGVKIVEEFVDVEKRPSRPDEQGTLPT